MKFFSIDELVRSDVATKFGIKNLPNTTEKKHLVELIENLLDPLREKWTEYCKFNNLGTGAIRITSGYRNAKVNKIVGGVLYSAHLLGYAADVQPLNKKYKDFEKWVTTEFIKSGIKFDQIIKERSKNSSWIHLGYKNFNGSQRMQTFSITK